MKEAWIDRQVRRLAKPARIVDDVYQLRALGAKVTVIVGEESAVLVDTGARGSRRLVEGLMQDRRVTSLLLVPQALELFRNGIEREVERKGR